MKTLVNKDNPAIRITAPSSEIKFVPEGKKFRSHWKIGGYILRADDWTLVEEESKHTEVWVEGRTIFEQDAKKSEVDLEKAAIDYGMRCYKRGFVDGKEWTFKQFSDILDKWEAHATEGMRVGASAYHQGKIALICDLRDWIKEQTKKQ